MDAGIRISLQAWVIRFLIADLTLFAIAGFVPASVGNALAPGLFSTTTFTGQENVLIVAVLVFLLSARIVHLYRTNRVLEQRSSLQRLLLTLILTFAALMALGAATKTTQTYSRLWFFSWLSTAFVLLPTCRLLALRSTRNAMRQGAYVHKALSVGLGTDPLSDEIVNRSSKGLVRVSDTLQIKDASELERLPDRIMREAIDKIYISAPWSLLPSIGAAIAALKTISAEVYLVPQEKTIADNVIGVRQIGSSIKLQITDRPIDGWNYWLKRTQDVTIATAALVLLSPLLIVVAALIKLGSPGPVLFRQPRMGFNGKVFEVWKFRSMFAEHSDRGASVQTSRNDRRVTRIGYFIRRTSIDELPQLVNVLQGTMSIVGPRPHALQTAAEGKLLAEAINDYASRHRVKPGITGWAQVHGLRGEIRTIKHLELRVHYDREYIARWSMLLDLKIIVLTLFRVASDPNAY